METICLPLHVSRGDGNVWHHRVVLIPNPVHRCLTRALAATTWKTSREKVQMFGGRKAATSSRARIRTTGALRIPSSTLFGNSSNSVMTATTTRCPTNWECRRKSQADGGASQSCQTDLLASQAAGSGKQLGTARIFHAYIPYSIMMRC